MFSTSRKYSGTTGTLTYDILDHLTQWYVSSSNQEQYLYDATGNRVLRRSTTSNGTTLIVYPFGLEEHQYGGSGTNQSNTYYYFLGNRLIGDLDANRTFYLLTDALGSILTDISWAAGGASIKGSQVFGPYGNARAYQGNINTAKGFTGQYNDPLTGLDYYVSRYYDPVVGMFLSADKKQGNLQGMDPYGYVGGNPETRSDPSGQMFIGEPGGGTPPPSQSPPIDDYWNDPGPLNDAGSHVPSGIVTAKPQPPARPTWHDPFTGLTSCGIAGSHFFTERQPCPSCQGVIEQSKEMFPNINVNVEWYQDSPSGK